MLTIPGPEAATFESLRRNWHCFETPFEADLDGEGRGLSGPPGISPSDALGTWPVKNPSSGWPVKSLLHPTEKNKERFGLQAPYRECRGPQEFQNFPKYVCW